MLTLRVHTQEHGRKNRPVAYSLQLDPVARAYPNRSQAVAAAVKIVESSSECVQRNILNLQVPHDIQILTEPTQRFLASRLTCYRILFLCPSHLCLLHCNSLNPPILLPLPNKEKTNNCIELASQNLIPRSKTPLANPAGYNATTRYELSERVLPQFNSDQPAELFVLT